MKKKTTNYALELALRRWRSYNKRPNWPKAKRICVGLTSSDELRLVLEKACCETSCSSPRAQFGHSAVA
jgi:hypothetical protein